MDLVQKSQWLNIKLNKNNYKIGIHFQKHTGKTISIDATNKN